MRTIVDGFREMVHLIGDTFRLWWRNLLPMATWFLAGYVGFKAEHEQRDLAGRALALAASASASSRPAC